MTKNQAKEPCCATCGHWAYSGMGVYGDCLYWTKAEDTFSDPLFRPWCFGNSKKCLTEIWTKPDFYCKCYVLKA